MPDADLIERLNIPVKPIRRLRANACPVIMPVEEAPTIAAGTELGADELNRRAAFLSGRPDLRDRLMTVAMQREEPPSSPHFERQLYDGFFPREDEALMERFHGLPWGDRPGIIQAFTDRRLRQIGKRLLYLERPDLLGHAMRTEFDRAVALRITTNDAERPWLTLPKAIAAIDMLLANVEAAEAAFLHDHRNHLNARLAAATLAADSSVATSATSRPLAE